MSDEHASCSCPACDLERYLKIDQDSLTVETGRDAVAVMIIVLGKMLAGASLGAFKLVLADIVRQRAAYRRHLGLPGESEPVELATAEVAGHG